MFCNDNTFYSSKEAKLVYIRMYCTYKDKEFHTRKYILSTFSIYRELTQQKG